MGRLVMKFGGTSVANIDRIRNVALHVKREVDAGHDVAVVVSAMSGKTNELVAWATDASPLRADLTGAVKTAMGAIRPGVPIFPSMSAGASDSMWYRSVGVPSYGVTLVQYQSGKLVALGGTL